jgi:hypothetical protein
VPLDAFACKPVRSAAKRIILSKNLSILVRRLHPLHQFKVRRTCVPAAPKMESAGMLAPPAVRVAALPIGLRKAASVRIETRPRAAAVPRHSPPRPMPAPDPVRAIGGAARAAWLDRSIVGRPPLRLAWLAGQLEIAGWTESTEETDVMQAVGASDDAFRVTMTLARPKLVRETPAPGSLRSLPWGIYVPRFAARVLRPRICAGQRPALASGY